MATENAFNEFIAAQLIAKYGPSKAIEVSSGRIREAVENRLAQSLLHAPTPPILN